MIWSVAVVAIVINAAVVGLMAARELVNMESDDG
jgi:hypothetical protein